MVLTHGTSCGSVSVYCCGIVGSTGGCLSRKASFTTNDQETLIKSLSISKFWFPNLNLREEKSGFDSIKREKIYLINGCVDWKA